MLMITATEQKYIYPLSNSNNQTYLSFNVDRYECNTYAMKDDIFIAVSSQNDLFFVKYVNVNILLSLLSCPL